MQKMLYCSAQRMSGSSKITRPRDSHAERELLGGLCGLSFFGWELAGMQKNDLICCRSQAVLTITQSLTNAATEPILPSGDKYHQDPLCIHHQVLPVSSQDAAKRQKKLYCSAQRISGPSKIARPRDSLAARELLGDLRGLWFFG